ncbi:hypothetical protein HMPREF0762_01382 [Slackia exigua ATCC 700122]|uniref:Uncharacterized protein n=1 Tax=Slackia exigua (strain ATCC 700122 / DSM 15923 / CIP 105133 / JCM 11022 / KCTC 5966 / S-7) TaxID=649764 RepID=D0WHR4_SLAES|nr:hypothetical protein HMPREF0762_01382 [Slackia exigua ATCC 700122]
MEDRVSFLSRPRSGRPVRRIRERAFEIPVHCSKPLCGHARSASKNRPSPLRRRIAALHGRASAAQAAPVPRRMHFGLQIGCDARCPRRPRGSVGYTRSPSSEAT